MLQNIQSSNNEMLTVHNKHNSHDSPTNESQGELKGELA
jgi:hypothetical protein